MKPPLVEIKQLSKWFNSPAGQPPLYALKEICLSIPEGSIYGIIGMSGAGKSTLLRCLTGLEIPSQGSLAFDGQTYAYQNPQAIRALRKQIGMVFQHFQLFSSRTVAGNIAYPLEIRGASAAQYQKRILELLSLVGLEAKASSYPSQLSGGEKQRVGIARALASHPRLLLCDEPTSALDPKTTKDLLHLLSELNQKLGLTIVLITHQLEVVKQICQRVAVLSQGQMVEEGEVQDVFTRPCHLVTQHLLHLSTDQFSSDLLQPQAGKSLVRLGFPGDQAKQPLLSHLLKQYDVDANILSGGLDYLQKTVVGHLFVEFSGPSEEIEKALLFLRHQKVICEVIR